MREAPTTITATLDELLACLRPGDIVSVQNGERGILNFLIGQVHGHLLKDMNPNLEESQRLSKKAIKIYAKFSHSMMVIDPTLDGGLMAENFFPHCRYVKLKDKLHSGSVVAVSRFKYFNPTHGSQHALECAAKDVQKETPYPIWKLFWYFGYSWGWQKTILGQPLMQVFKYGMPGKQDDNWQVCSGSCWKWLTAGRDPEYQYFVHRNDRHPESWYPARIASDLVYFRDIGIYKLK
jgi:hypothetical protein